MVKERLSISYRLEEIELAQLLRVFNEPNKLPSYYNDFHFQE
jgi:hypothetical protein